MADPMADPPYMDDSMAALEPWVMYGLAAELARV